MELTKAQESTVLVGLSDDIHIGDILMSVVGGMYSLQKPLSQEIRQQAIQLIEQLIEMGLIEAGIPQRGSADFERWNLSPNETIARIEQKWDDLDHVPAFGDIVWFRLTPLGREIAKKIEEREETESPDGLA